MTTTISHIFSYFSSTIQDSTNVCLTVAVLRYETLGKQRTGVASTYLQDRLQLGQTIPAFISRNPDFKLPDAGNRAPIIMIGPGIGIAPFRAFIQERGY